MAEGEDQKPADDGGTASATTKLDSSLSPRIRDIGAIVTILGAILGFCFTAYQLHEKSKADEETAKLNRAGEADKLSLGKAQIDSQNKQFDYQNSQHSADLNLQLRLHELDIKQKEDAAAAVEKKDERNALALLVGGMFYAKSSEADIAGLSEYIHRDAASRDIVENAIVAKLENPKSPEEIDLGFRILEEIGPKSIPSIIRINCVARSKLDTLLIKSFDRRYRAGLTDSSNIALSDDTLDLLDREVAERSTLDHRYIFATLNAHYKGSNDLLSQDSLARQSIYPSDGEERDLVLNDAVIEQSSDALDHLLHILQPTPHRRTGFDFSTAYLTLELVSDTSLTDEVKDGGFTCGGCFLEGEEEGRGFPFSHMGNAAFIFEPKFLPPSHIGFSYYDPR